MIAGIYNITIEQGSGFRLPMYFQPGGIQADMTGYTARMQIRRSYSSPTKLIDLTTENDDDGNSLVIDVESGSITAVLSAETTQTLSFTRAVWDIELIPPGGEPFRLLKGTVLLSREVTR